jgi:hypothetical protein
MHTSSSFLAARLVVAHSSAGSAYVPIVSDDVDCELEGDETMATASQRSAARRNIKKAAKAAKRKRTVAHLPKKTRTALGKEGAKAAKRKRQGRS